MRANNKHGSFIPARKYMVISLFLLLVSMLMLSLSATRDEIPSGSYAFSYPAYFGNRIIIPESNPTTNAGVYLGRRLFYEKRLSANNRICCASCHEQKRAFTDGKARSLGADNTLSQRNSMSLVNLLWNRTFFWDGRSSSLEEQAVFPLTNPHEMGQSLALSASKLKGNAHYRLLFKAAFADETITPESIVKALSQFERTIISADSRYDRFLQGTALLSPREHLGLKLFNEAPNPQKGIRGGNCAHCHGGKKNYLELFHNNGLDSVYADKGIGAISGNLNDDGRFKVPTLRNIALTGPYMHDGRFAKLNEVLDHYSEHIRPSASLSGFLQDQSNEPNAKTLKLSPEEKNAIIAFLYTLTDSTLISDPRFSDPFKKINTKK